MLQREWWCSEQGVKKKKAYSQESNEDAFFFSFLKKQTKYLSKSNHSSHSLGLVAPRLREIDAWIRARTEPAHRVVDRDLVELSYEKEKGQRE